MDSTFGFGKLRSFFWPIARSETRKLVPMLLIFFFIAFDYNLLRSFKDSLIVTAHGSGAEAIPFIKVWAILPMAIAFTYLFTRLTNRYSREKVFYIMMGIFLTFFFIFTFFLYPAREALHPNETADKLQLLLPAGFKGLIALYRNWTFTAFYVMSELWSTAILTVLFWGFANEITKVGEARRFYGIFAIGANFSAILSGQAAVFFSGSFFFPSIPYGSEPWEQSVLFLNCAVIGCGLAAMALFRWLNARVLTPEERGAIRADYPRAKMSMRKNFATLAKSKYLLLIALIVVAYNLGINLIEIVWKNQIKELYPDPAGYNAYMGEVMTATGVVALITSLFMGNLLRRFSWTKIALVPPLIALTTGGLFFAFVYFSKAPLWTTGIFLGLSPLLLSVTFGSVQNCVARASKYTLFDATKELAFIPLDRESKLKGKAAIDGVGSRLGKSGGSVIHQSFLLLFGSLAVSAPYIGMIFLVTSFIWILSVVALGKRFDNLATTQENENKTTSFATN
jgi:AAA family ATP:ADP antiporter